MSRDRATLEAYERWAPLYAPVAHNPVMRVEQRSMMDLWPAVSGRRVLDLACGSGRYARMLEDQGAAQVVALDFCTPMLSRASATCAINRVCADMMQLPFAEGVFDVIVSGLAVGHAASLQRWLCEAARVLSGGGTLLYSDFHPEAIRAGFTRSFKDRQGRTCAVPHHCYDVAAHREAAAAAGLKIDSLNAARVGIELCEPFAHSEDLYRRWHGLPIVLAVRARK